MRLLVSNTEGAARDTPDQEPVATRCPASVCAGTVATGRAPWSDGTAGGADLVDPLVEQEITKSISQNTRNNQNTFMIAGWYRRFPPESIVTAFQNGRNAPAVPVTRFDIFTRIGIIPAPPAEE